MRVNASLPILALAFVVFLPGLATNAQADDRCSDLSIKGSYGFVITGERIGGNNPGPRAEVGLMMADGRGNLTGSVTKSANGVISTNVSFSGTYAVNTDCTGSVRFTDADSDIRNGELVLVREGKEILFIQTDTGRVKTGSAQRVR